MMLLPLVAMMQCLPPNVAKPRIIRRNQHHLRDRQTSFAEGKHHSKNAPLSVDKSAFFVGGEREIRTLGRVLAYTRFPVNHRKYRLFENPQTLAVSGFERFLNFV